MKRVSLGVVMFLLLLLGRADAVILYGEDNTGNTDYASLDAAGYGDIPWENIARIGGVDATAANGTGIYLGNGYVLTANHVNPQDTPKIEIDGIVYDYDAGFTPQQVAVGVDLKIFKIVGSPVLDDVILFSGTDEVGSNTTVMVGWGQGKGTEVPAVGWGWGGDVTNAKRWGTNLVEDTTTATGGGYNYEALLTYFDSDQGADEFSATLRDSGSPIFQFHDGSWQLVGITTSVEVNGQSYYNPAQYTLTVRISEYRDEILALIPEPTTLAAALFGVALLISRRRR